MKMKNGIGVYATLKRKRKRAEPRKPRTQLIQRQFVPRTGEPKGFSLLNLNRLSEATISYVVLPNPTLTLVSL